MVHPGFEKGLSTLATLIAIWFLAGCVKTDSVTKTESSGVSEYAEQVRSAIQRNFYDVNLYYGKQCDLRIKLAPDGMLLDVQAVDGDPVLCRAAVKATANTKFPKPPSQAVYSVFKNAVLDFRPGAIE